MKFLKFTISFLCLVLSCKKESALDASGIIMEYSPSQCAEKWQNGTTKAETSLIITKYLKENNIFIKKISIIDPPLSFVSCQACTCPSGAKIVVTVDYTFESKLKTLGYITTGIIN